MNQFQLYKNVQCLWLLCALLVNRSIIEQYYWEGFEYKAILIFLEQYHGIRISMRTLLRRLASYGLYRRGQPASLTSIWQAVSVELTGPGLFTTTYRYIYCYYKDVCWYSQLPKIVWDGLGQAPKASESWHQVGGRGYRGYCRLLWRS